MDLFILVFAWPAAGNGGIRLKVSGFYSGNIYEYVFSINILYIIFDEKYTDYQTKSLLVQIIFYVSIHSFFLKLRNYESDCSRFSQEITKIFNDCLLTISN